VVEVVLVDQAFDQRRGAGEADAEPVVAGALAGHVQAE
jgi:hypothetical protein